VRLVVDVGEVIIIMLTTDATESVIFRGFGQKYFLLLLLHFVYFIEVEIVVRIQILLHLVQVTLDHEARCEIITVRVENRSGPNGGRVCIITIVVDARKDGEVDSHLSYTFRGIYSFDMEGCLMSGGGLFFELQVFQSLLHNLLLISAFLHDCTNSIKSNPYATVKLPHPSHFTC